ncbi:hypothetical protein C8R45DRAFT_1173969 [Mycena sanguinolenta]|nr:hypothetical protein C8R45DRAFT_1173969 [Mycena sanguinolenta]
MNGEEHEGEVGGLQGARCSLAINSVAPDAEEEIFQDVHGCRPRVDATWIFTLAIIHDPFPAFCHSVRVGVDVDERDERHGGGAKETAKSVRKSESRCLHSTAYECIFIDPMAIYPVRQRTKEQAGAAPSRIDERIRASRAASQVIRGGSRRHFLKEDKLNYGASAGDADFEVMVGSRRRIA